MTTKIMRINQISKERPKEKFTSVYHLINYELLKECYDELDGNKAIGLDKITKDIYLLKLNENLNNLVDRLKTMSYKPSPARKINIPKSNGKVRGLAIANFEDKIVQLAVKKIVEAIYEPKFTDNMFGFRPNKGCHEALRYLSECIQYKQTNYILDADIKGYFDNIDHEKLIKCLEKHIGDKKLIRLIKRFLKAGIMENGKYIKGEYGTPQGSILSPILANVYMYYLLILWFEEIKANAEGYVEIVNYADDMIICFKYNNEAKRIYQQMKKRLATGNLEFAEDKTRLIEFGKYATERRKRKGKGRPETFDFLGFTHYCSESKKQNRFRVKRKTSKKKYRQKLKEFNIWMKHNRHKRPKEIMPTITKKLQGHYNYYGITDNYTSIAKFSNEIRKIIFKWLNRRSQRKSFTSEKFNMFLKTYQLPKPKIMVEIY